MNPIRISATKPTTLSPETVPRNGYLTAVIGAERLKRSFSWRNHVSLLTSILVNKYLDRELVLSLSSQRHSISVCLLGRHILIVLSLWHVIFSSFEKISKNCFISLSDDVLNNLIQKPIDAFVI